VLSLFKLGCILEGHYAQVFSRLRAVGTARSSQAETVSNLIAGALELTVRPHL
jgi:hypothetical protein